MMPGLVEQMVAALTGVTSRLFRTTPLRTTRSTTIIVGLNARTRLLAAELGTAGKGVSLIEPEDCVLRDDADAQDEALLERAGAEAAQCLIAATSNGELNVSLCRTARDAFGIPMVIARLNLVEGITSWARVNDAGMVRMTWGDTVRAILGGTEPSQGLSRLARIPDPQQIYDLEMNSPVFAGRKIGDLPLNDCEVLGLTRNSNPVTDLGSIDLCMNDVLTLVGTKAALTKVRESLTSL